MRRVPVFALLFCVTAPVFARREPSLCGTTVETANERIFLHGQSLRARKGARSMAVAAISANRDAGNIAIIEDADGIVARQNEFNLDLKTLRFTPGTSGYAYAVLDGGYDETAASFGAPLAALDDDDSRLVALPFAFPFFGAAYREVYVNSDGNLTFTVPDTASTDRSLGRMTAGPARISPLFDDLDPAQTAGGVRVLSEARRVVVSWVATPEWVASGIGARQTFQATLYPDGRIEFAYSGVTPTNGVVGIAPGGLKGATALLDYRTEASAVYSGAVAERFGSTLDIDVVTVAQRFYETHEDSYDYLAIYNNMDIAALPGSIIAYESTVRSRGTGYGLATRDDGAQYGSASRLQAVLNMGPLGQYPKDPNAVVPARAQAGDTPLTTLAHETGHLFLAYASVADPNDPTAKPMLGFQNQHWSFVFNSEASLLEGERIQDRAGSASPRFLTTDTVQDYSPLDQYLMGWRAPTDVPGTFVVTGAPAYLPTQHPARGVAFDGERRNIALTEVIQAMGRRTPDDTIAQRRFRFAIILVTPPGANPSPADVAQVDTYRQQFEAFFAKASSNRAVADTALRRSLRLSLFPAAGIVQGGSGTATIAVRTAPSVDLPIALQTVNGNANFPSSVIIPAGATSALFSYSGTRPGVEELTATPGDSAYETAFARVQVGGAAELKLVETSPDPLTVRLTDANGLVYPGSRVMASALTGGSVAPGSAITDAQGQVTFQWSPGAGAANQLQLALEAIPAVSLTLRAGSAVPSIAAVVNAASSASGIAAGAIESIYGAHLTGARVSLNGTPLPVLYTGETEINLYVPVDTAAGSATLELTTPSGERASRTVEVKSVQPGIFSAVVSGGYITVYCTGLGPVKAGADGLQHTTIAPVVFIGAVPVAPVFSGLSPGSPGLYQVNVAIPPGIAPGVQSVLLSVSLEHSNQVEITVN
jgi:uncharacterized protein (TIGR03437 family)